MTSSTSSRPSSPRTWVWRLGGSSPIRTYLIADPSPRAPRASEVPPRGLLALDRLEQRLEVPLSEPAGAVALDDLEEDRRPVAERLREDLQEVALVVAVDEDPQAPQVVEVLGDLADAVGDLVVVGVRRAQELHAPLGERTDHPDDVARR